MKLFRYIDVPKPWRYWFPIPVDPPKPPFVWPLDATSTAPVEVYLLASLTAFLLVLMYLLTHDVSLPGWAR